ncbi:cell division protein ZipA C-terminal FtsZ-binding domain-containing protein [Halomonas sp. HMF6819]|uniref:cell division protein ZipA C-terminal FtsZ-binding domain-containing protein n=1 Tax=Halomonas sp. HMF6819 TaxID=3373085 RepID=UPI00379961A2
MPSVPAAAGKKRQHSLFVIFARPDVTTDERLTEWLRGKNARFDSLKRVFLIDGHKRTNPIIIANAFPPGEMPDLLRGESHDTIRGVSLLVKPPIHRRRNQQMHVYVALAKEMNDTFRGDILDSEQNPVSEVTYQQILGETSPT